MATGHSSTRVASRTGRTSFHLTRQGPRSIFAYMSEENPKETFERELGRLDKRIDELVVVCDRLQEENQSLKQRQDQLIAERAGLLQKNEQVRARVEAMITRLKAMEHGT